MTKQDLIRNIAIKTGQSQNDVSAIVDAFMSTINASMAAGERVVLTGFGTFDLSRRQAREARNPATGEAMQIPAKTFPRFSPGKHLKDAAASAPIDA